METIKEKIAWAVRSCAPYVMMLLATFAACAIYFIPGISAGDDQGTHLAYIQDILYGLENGFHGLSVSHKIMGIFGYNFQTFYAPFPQYCVAYIAYIFRYSGIGIIQAIKITNMFFVFVSSVYVYLLAKRVTNSRPIATAFGVGFVFFPYRLVCIFYRCALSEAIAIAFIPIAFYAAYRILHDEKPKVGPYVNMVIGIAGLVLSHPFTAMISVLSLLLYIIACFPQILKISKRVETYVYTGASLLLIVGLIAFWVLPMFQALNSGLYRVSDNEAMWTNKEHMIWSVSNSYSFSGILDLSWITDFREDYGWTATADTAAKWTLELIVLCVTCASSIALREVGRRKGWKLFWVNLIVGAILFIPTIFYLPRIEIVMTLLFFYALLWIFDIDPTMKEESLPLRQGIKSAVLSTEVYAAIIVFVFFMIFVLSAEAWEWLPSVFYTAQFAWRAWSMVGIGAMLIGVVVCKVFKGRKLPLDIITFAAVLLLGLSQTAADKRIAFANGNYHYREYDTSSLDEVRAIGAQDEYSPLVFWDNTYHSPYSNSLYNRVRYYMLYQNGFIRDIDRYISPEFLEGSGDMIITELNTPEAKFDLTVDSDEAYIQLPQFYYDGYEITLTSDGGSETFAPVYQDGLLAFRATKGEYKVNLHYAGSKTYRIARPFFYISIVGVIGLGVGGYIWSKKKAKKEAEALEAQEEAEATESPEVPEASETPEN